MYLLTFCATIFVVLPITWAEEPYCPKHNFEEEMLERLLKLGAQMEAKDATVDKSVEAVRDQMKLIEENLKKWTSDLRNEIKELRAEAATRQKTKPTFTVCLDHAVSLGAQSVIIFNKVLYNQGNAYNTNTGIFTVPVSGTYLFNYAIVHWETPEVVANLMVDYEVKASVVISPKGTSTQSSNSVILELNYGQNVWVQTVGEGNFYGSSTFRGNTFSGALLY